MLAAEDTIVAVSTALVSAARAVVRMSGSESLPMAQSIFQGPVPLGELAPYRVTSGRLHLDDLCLDTVVYVMRAPRSYTREDVVELHLPGSPALTEMVFSRLVRLGARPAEAGEFTRRAFLAGRLDLSQAEAVLKLIRAADEVHHRAALSELDGHLGRAVREATDLAARALSLVELRIDFSDQGVDYIDLAQVRDGIGHAARVIDKIERSTRLTAPPGALPRVALAGRVNAGKSSLLNMLAGKQRAIVHHRSGTTRDTIETELTVDDVGFVFVDTAGTEGPGDEIEREALRLTQRAQARADFVLIAVDASVGYGEPECALAAAFPDRALAVITKRDLADDATVDRLAGAIDIPVKGITSAVSGRGIADLARAIAEHLASAGAGVGREAALVTARQREALRQANAHLRDAAQADAEEIIALELREAIEALGLISGAQVGDDALERIFSEFCIGK